MLKEILASLLSNCENNIQGIYAGEYKDEFEEGADWNPREKTALFRLAGFNPKMRVMGGAGIPRAVNFIVYICGKSGSVLDLVEAVTALHDGPQLAVTIGTGETATTEYRKISIDDTGAQHHAYVKGVQVYTLGIEVIG